MRPGHGNGSKDGETADPERKRKGRFESVEMASIANIGRGQKKGMETDKNSSWGIMRREIMDHD